MARMPLEYRIDLASLSSPGAPQILTLLRPSWTPWASVLQAATEQPTRRRWFLALCTNLKRTEEKSEPDSLALAGAHPAVVQLPDNRGQSPWVPGTGLPHCLLSSRCFLTSHLPHCKNAHVLTEAGEGPSRAPWELQTRMWLGWVTGPGHQAI